MSGSERPQPRAVRSVLAPMADSKTSTTNDTRRFRQLLAFALLCAALVAAIAIPTAVAVQAKVIGKTKDSPRPSCPNKNNQNNCQVVGRVTGFMTIADGNKHPFNVFKNGKVVAFAIDLSRPLNTKKYPQKSYFGQLFESKKYGKTPTARLAVIKKKSKKRYKLIRQSPVVKLGDALGHKQIYTLNKPLRVRKGQVVALTYPTWASNFASTVSPTKNQWKGSRKRTNCAPKSGSERDKRAFARDSHPQDKVDSIRRYNCLYKGGRLLYWAYFVPNKK
jgi:hypothetical protein